jgi:hypothetical protein
MASPPLCCYNDLRIMGRGSRAINPRPRSACASLICGLREPMSLLSCVPAPHSLSPPPVIEDQAAESLLPASVAWSVPATAKHTGANGYVSATDWHAIHQMPAPHLLSWQPVVLAPNPSLAHGSTARPAWLPAAPAAAWLAASRSTGLAVHLTGKHSDLAHSQVVRGLRPHAVGKVLSAPTPACSVPAPAALVCSDGAVRRRDP